MKNLELMKKEVIEILPKVRESLRLKRIANKQLQDMQELIKDSYCYQKFKYTGVDIQTGTVLYNAIQDAAHIINDYGVTTLGGYISRTSFDYSSRPFYEFFKNIKYVNNYSLLDLLDDIVEHVSGGDSYDKREYIVKGNKIKYIAGRYCSGMTKHRIFCTMLNFIQLYEISLNKDITSKDLRAKLSDAFNKNTDLDVIVYKHIKITVFQNGNYEITFGNKKELEKVYKTIMEAINYRKAHALV